MRLRVEYDERAVGRRLDSSAMTQRASATSSPGRTVSRTGRRICGGYVDRYHVVYEIASDFVAIRHITRGGRGS